MKRFSEQLKKKSETIRLRASEKRELHDKLVTFMEYHPLPKTNHAKAKADIFVEPYRLISIPSNYLRTFVGLTAVMLLVIIPTLAEESVPGDILYPVKVNLTEEIRSSLSLNSYEKVAWETTRLERRISEARLLAKEGKLTPEVEADVLVAVQAHKVETERQIETLRSTDEEGAALAQMTFATMLGVQSSVLKSNDSASTTEGKSTVALSSVIDAGFSEATSHSNNDKLSEQRLRAQLEIETTRSYELLNNIESSATDQEISDVRRRLSDLEFKISSIEDHSADDQSSSTQELRSAWKDLQKLISFMTDIDVRHSVAIETLVPVVMTNEERLSVALDHYAQAKKEFQRINSNTQFIADEDIAAKVNVTLPKIKELLATASSTMYTSVSEAQGASDEALALTQSILNMYSFPDAADDNIGDTATSSTASTTEDVSDNKASTTEESKEEQPSV